ncbi:MAG: ARMT1-like domain-containing protein [Candidatus Cloacimonetes bacterium]|nr:ARMT1-like domain-containing protein [Candidatus Cloacimonadota bacterium]MCF7813893.1 ARMT1-like domain-containing protein [Candidatus Cloacimonadota bacterium]MCF7868896.1 ARMT1-like domain-containing protein [Candidatus Cloacimonadota bacterium]MCF7884005.1 ARMT1-like domain-containing protein [Candidatus Cloacimonadota bacterium]
MKTYLDCFPCFLQQALRAGRIAGADEQTLKKLLDEVGQMLKDIPLSHTPPETGEIIYGMISKITGNSDPYKKIKQQNIEYAMQLYPDLKNRIKKSEDPLLTAIRLAIAGNVIDLGVNRKFDLVKDIETVLEQEFTVFDYQRFKAGLANSDKILYLADNAGETVFDKLLIEELRKPVIYAVREIPVLNDVTIVEARQIGIDKVATVISSGSTAPGTILKNCSPSFIEIFNNSDLIISKGQGNYEGLSGEDAPIFFLLKVKCEVIGRDLEVPPNAIILKGSEAC